MEKRNRTSCVLGADNQAAIQALQSELIRPGQHLAAEFVKLANQIAKHRGKRNYSLTIRWTAGHSGITWNEKADAEAKSAAEGVGSEKADLPKYLRKPIRSSISASKQKHNEMLNEIWKAEWQSSERYKRFKAPDIILPASKKFLALTNDHRISRRMANLIFQLRIGHAPLNGYLLRFGGTNSARCPACREDRETTEHFILRCPKYAHERWALLQHLRDSAPKIEDVLSNTKVIIPLINHIEATGRLEVPQTRIHHQRAHQRA